VSIVIHAENISKAYRLGQLDGRSFLAEWRARLSGKPARNEAEGIWALRDLSFDVREGDVVGLLGRNGAGKSTLLKLLSAIMAPTTGRIRIKGRVASLLEVGTGFHMELTGRENVFLNGAILGMNRREVTARFDEIVAFSGVEQFIDTPVKRYSSGMRMRLAFAVAAHLDSEIVILDEVLAVGDAGFQRKCLDKVGALARSGRTIFFVAHQAATVEALCTRGMVLNKGRLEFDGTQTEALSHYYASEQVAPLPLSERADREGSGEVRLTGVEILNGSGFATDSVPSGGAVTIRLGYTRRTAEVFPHLVVSLQVTTQLGVPVFCQSNWFTGEQLGVSEESGVFVCHLPRLPLPESVYRVECRVVSEGRGGRLLDGLKGAFEFRVGPGDFYGSGKTPTLETGLAFVEGKWAVEGEFKSHTLE
jgi:lipopolysaccharide transport system ATP-binding protein